MPTPHLRSRPSKPATRPKKPDRRQALELLTACPDGCTDALMLANGFTAELLVELIHAGLASAQVERMVAAGQPIEVARVRITEAGRRVVRGALL
jgi:hypothetical protein